jgi:small-conductance mechanosensitive channel
LKSFKSVARPMANMAKYTILVFAALAVLNQLGVAQSLIQILFTGIVFMVALAGGLAFGLGGQEVAKELLSDLKDNLKKK